MYEGLIPRITRTFLSKNSHGTEQYRKDIQRIVVDKKCPSCSGGRLNEKVLNCKINKKSIADCTNMTITDLIAFLKQIRSSYMDTVIEELLKQLTFAEGVGLGYLTLKCQTSTLSGGLSLGQPLTTLSGGELQRLKLAVELKESKSTYVLDEAITGLHSKDIGVLLSVFDELIKSGSTLIVIEYNFEIICQADWIIDLGPGTGELGGQVLFQGGSK